MGERTGVGLNLSFLGGAGTVTGSKYLLEHDEHKLLVDCFYAAMNSDIIAIGDSRLATHHGDTGNEAMAQH